MENHNKKILNPRVHHRHHNHFATQSTVASYSVLCVKQRAGLAGLLPKGHPTTPRRRWVVSCKDCDVKSIIRDAGDQYKTHFPC